MSKIMDCVAFDQSRLYKRLCFVYRRFFILYKMNIQLQVYRII